MVLLILCAPSVVQILALEIDFRAAQLPRQILGKIQRRRTPDIMLQIKLELFLEFGIVPRFVVQLSPIP